MIHIQPHYRDSDGALIFVDLQEFEIPDNRQCIILSINKYIQDLEQYTGTKIPCILVGTKVKAYVIWLDALLHDKTNYVCNCDYNYVTMSVLCIVFYHCDYE